MNKKVLVKSWLGVLLLAIIAGFVFVTIKQYAPKAATTIGGSVCRRVSSLPNPLFGVEKAIAATSTTNTTVSMPPGPTKPNLPADEWDTVSLFVRATWIPPGGSSNPVGIPGVDICPQVTTTSIDGINPPPRFKPTTVFTTTAQGNVTISGLPFMTDEDKCYGVSASGANTGAGITLAPNFDIDSYVRDYIRINGYKLKEQTYVIRQPYGPLVTMTCETKTKDPKSGYYEGYARPDTDIKEKMFINYGDWSDCCTKITP